MAVPKRRISTTRKNKRRSSVWKLETPELVKCPHCGELTAPHKVCGNCGYYGDKEVVKEKVKTDKGGSSEN